MNLSEVQDASTLDPVWGFITAYPFHSLIIFCVFLIFFGIVVVVISEKPIYADKNILTTVNVSLILTMLICVVASFVVMPPHWEEEYMNPYIDSLEPTKVPIQHLEITPIDETTFKVIFAYEDDNILHYEKIYTNVSISLPTGAKPLYQYKDVKGNLSKSSGFPFNPGHYDKSILLPIDYPLESVFD